MTCIAGAVINGELCIGGDAVSIQGDSNVRISAEGKVFRLGEFLIGSSGTMHMRQVMTYLYEPPAIKGDLTAYMVRHFIPGLRGMMKEHGCEEQTSNGTTEMEGQYLIGVRGRLFSIDGGYGLFQPRLPYAAIGCAAQEALAAMFTAYSLLKDPLAEDIVNRGLLAAAEFDTSVRPPFTVTIIPAEVSRETLVLKNGWYVEQLAKV
jgi:ATP-dependent protease HslVU (ClpYQ) peptidase subunit